MITLHTIIYEGNFREVLTDTSWFITFNSCYIKTKMLTVNNVESIDELEKLLKKYPEIFVIYVNEHKEESTKNYKLNINETTLGYYYTIPYFVAIDNIKTPYILNVASDCMNDINISDEFLSDSILELTINPDCSTTMVAWTKNNYIMANGKKIGEYEEFETTRILNAPENKSILFNRTANFTDQLFLGSVYYLKNIDYNIDESFSNRFYNGPLYGGNSFEKRMVGSQIKHNQYNCIYKGNDYYIHDGKYY